MAFQRPSHFAETEALESWWLLRAVSLGHGFSEGPHDHITMTRLTFAAKVIQDF